MRLQYRRDLLAVQDDLLALLDKAASEAGLADLTEWERAILGMTLCFVTATLMLPDRPYPSLTPSRN